MMSFPSSSRALSLPNLASCLAGLVVLLTLGACEDKHIGRPCDIGVDMTTPEPKLAIVNAQALECPSRLCILPDQNVSTDTGALCTDECSNDDDCSGGETRGSGTADKRCRHGFVCRTIIPKLDRPLACKPVCVCKDFLVTDDPNVKPPSCL